MSKRFNKLREEADSRDRKSNPVQDKLLPTHSSHADDETPDEPLKKQEIKDSKKSPGEKLLPTQESDAAAQVPEDEKQAAGAAKQKAKPQLDGQKVADGAAKDGVQKKVVKAESKEEEELEEEDEEKKDLDEEEEEDKDLDLDESDDEDKDDLDEEEEEEKDLDESDDEDEDDDLELDEESDEEEEEAKKKEIEEHISSLLKGQNLSEDFRSKATTLFEVAVNERVGTIKTRLQEKAKTLVEKKLRKEVEKIVDHVDNYLDYAIQEWISENEVAIDTGLKIEVTESLVSGFRSLLEESGVEVPEDEEDVANKQFEKNAELEDELDKQIEANIALKKENAELKKENILREASEDLADTEKERLRELVSSFSFDNEKSFSEKVETIREHYLKKPVQRGKTSNEILLEQGGIEDQDGKVVKNPLESYVAALSRSSKNK